MSIRLLIADDHELVRTGLVSLLGGTEIEIVAQAASGPEAVAMAKQHTPDVVLLDIRMNDTDGLSAIEEIRRDVPNAKIVMLSTYDNPTYMARANAMGAHDYVLKGASQEQLVGAIRAAFEGRAPSEYGELAKVAGTMATRNKQPGAEVQLTQRETQVLRHLALGLSNKEIAQSLSISIETVKEHVQHLLRKMDVADRTQAAVWAVRNGLV
jgi:DNA-binding NarL/FixJ family response regulator